MKAWKDKIQKQSCYQAKRKVSEFVFGVLLMTVVVLLVSAGCGMAAKSADKGEKELPVITVGCDIYPPYTYTGSDGQPTGVDIEVARAALGRLG